MLWSGGVPGLAGEDPAEGETVEPPGTASALRRGLRVLGEDAGAIYSAPARWSRKGWTAFTAIVAGTAVLVQYDDEIRAEVLESDAPDRRRAAKLLQRLGDPLVGAVLPWVSYAAASRADSPPLKQTSLLAFEAWALSGAASGVLKIATGRAGPGDGSEDDFFGGGDHFPSGHTARSFAIAALCAERHGKRAAWIGYPLAALVGLSRIETDYHWTSDVVAGAALGISIGRALAARHPLAPAGGEGAAGTAGRSADFLPADRTVEWTVRPLSSGLLCVLRF